MMLTQPLLKKFNEDEAMVEEVKRFLLSHLDILSLERVYNKQETGHLADARQVILEAFNELEQLYPKVENKEFFNEAM